MLKDSYSQEEFMYECRDVEEMLLECKGRLIFFSFQVRWSPPVRSLDTREWLLHTISYDCGRVFGGCSWGKEKIDRVRVWQRCWPRAQPSDPRTVVQDEDGGVRIHRRIHSPPYLTIFFVLGGTVSFTILLSHSSPLESLPE